MGKIMFIIENFRTGEILSSPNEDDNYLWDKVEEMESRGMRHLIVRMCTSKELKELKK